MSRSKKIFFSVIGIFVFVVILLIGVVLLLPYLISMEPIKEKILAVLSQEVGGEVGYQSLELSYFPHPRVKMTQVSLSIPGNASGTVKSMQAYPEILAILRGKVRVSRVELESPDVSIRLPKAREKTTEKPKLSPLQEIGGAIAQVSAVASRNFPNLDAVVKDGSVNVYEESQLVLSFRNLDGRILFSHAIVRVEVSCRSNLWEKISVQAAMNSVDFKGQGQIEIVNFYPHVLTDSLVRIAPWRIEESRMNLQVRFEIEGPKTLQADVDATIPLIALHQGSKAVVIRGMDLKGRAQVDGERMEVSLRELTLDHPHLKLSGKFQKESQPPHVALNVEVRDVDVGLMRESALAMAGEVPTVQEIFDYARGGQIPLITLSSQGRSIQDLGETGNLAISGRIEGGKVFIRPAKLNLEKVAGDMVISRGILQGKNLEASIGNSKAREGTLKLGLEGGKAPFHLEMMLDADLTQVQSILNGLVQDEGFRKESPMIDILKGRAKGRLILGESLESMNARIDVSELSLSAKYRRIPYPLEITTGQFRYEGDRIGLKNLAGKVGRSSFSELTGQLSAGKEAYLEILSGKIAISLEDVHPWLSSQKSLGDALKDIKSVRGTVNFTEVNLKGPLSRPKNWDFQAAGDMRNLAVETTLVPGPIKVTSGKFRVDPKRLSVSNFETHILDASLNVSGTLYDYPQGLEKAEMEVSGWVTPKDMEWLSDLLHLKGKTNVRAPFSISGAHLSWHKGVSTSFKGDVTMKDGPQISFDVIQNPQQLKVNRLLIRDEASQATLTLDLQKQAVGLTFSGGLFARTLDKVFSGYPLGKGWVKGDFKAHILIDQPMQSTAQGKLEAHDLSAPWQFERPLKIGDISLDATGNRISVARGTFGWGDMRFALSGDANFSEEKLLLTVDLSTERLDLNEVKKVLAKDKGVKDKEEKRTQGIADLRVEGHVRFKSTSVTYDRFTLAPFQAEISFVPGRVRVDVTEASICGVSTSGTVDVTSQDLSLDVQTFAKTQNLNTTVSCFLGKQVRMTGGFDLKGRLKGKGESKNLPEFLSGNMELAAQKGRIYQLNLLSKVLSVINVTETLKGRFPDFGQEGLAYDSLTLKAELLKGKIVIKEAILQGPTVHVASRGEIDPFGQKVDLTVLVAPLRTVDSVISKIPLIRFIFGGTLISIPVKVTGDLNDPRVTPLSPSAVGSELLGIMKRTLQLPIRLMRPFMPKKEEEQDAP